MYDEAIQRILKRQKNFPPIKFESKYLTDLVNNFRSDNPKTVILTGTAGDGKTFYCREIWQSLATQDDLWDSSKKIQSLSLGNKQLVVVKDLSELNSIEKIDLLKKVAEAIVNPDTAEVYLLAANDGQLVEAWVEAGNESSVQFVRKKIEDLLYFDQREIAEVHLYLYNLSRLNAAKIFPRILNAIIEHPGWNECSSCPYSNPSDFRLRCPIVENRSRLEGNPIENIFKSRLVDLLELCDLNGMHIPVRQMLLMIANALLGHPEVKDRLMTCEDIPNILDKGKASLASIYRNFFGENLSERRRESTDVFSILGRFGIGNESSNRIDNTLIFGEDDPDLRPYYEKLMLTDSYYGADANYQRLQRAYLEGALPDDEEAFLNLLRDQRQRLFFQIPKDLASEMQLWQLTAFQYAGEFLENIYRALQRSERIKMPLINRLVKGLNRIFTGLLVKNQDKLILATSGSYSQARISRVFEEFISVTKNRGESVSIDLDANTGNPILVVSLSNNVAKISMTLNLTRYEYIMRVAEGALPNSFSRECYEDILAFKTRILRQLFVRRRSEQEEESSENCIVLRLINELDSDGMVHNPHVLEINI